MLAMDIIRMFAEISFIMTVVAANYILVKMIRINR